MKSTVPDYKTIYTDILVRKYPGKKKECEHILEKKSLSTLDIIALNELIFCDENASENQQFRSYNMQAVAYILNYQKKHKLNNTQIAAHFKLSRNTISKWKRDFSCK